MAIDTAAKRLSALDFCQSLASSMPAPDGSFSLGNLYQLIGLYSGIAEPETGGGGPVIVPHNLPWLSTMGRFRSM